MGITVINSFFPSLFFPMFSLKHTQLPLESALLLWGAGFIVYDGGLSFC